MGWSRSVGPIRMLYLMVALAVFSAASLSACVRETVPPPGTAPPSMRFPDQSGIATIVPDYQELPVDQNTGPAATVPWHLIRVDHQENRIYLSASSAGCSTPEKVRLTESTATIAITVAGTGGSGPCTMQSQTLVGYVQVGSIGERQITGNSS